jgi:integrase
VLYKRPDSKFWWFRFVVDGKEYAKSTKTANKRLAADIEAAERTRVIKEGAGILQPASAKVETLNGFSKRFLDEIYTTIKNKRTRRYYTDAWLKLLEHKPFADCPLDKVSPLLIDEFKAARVKAGDTPYMINPVLRILRRALHLAEHWQLIPRAHRISLLEMHPRETVITEGDLAQIVRFCEPTMRAALTVAFDTGMRAGELCQLQWRDVRFADSLIRLQNGRDRNVGLKSKAAERKIPLTARARTTLEALKPAVGEPVPTAYVFVRHGQPLNVSWLSHRFTAARRAAKLPEGIVLHSARHSYLTRLARTGIGLFGFMAIAGHTSPEVSKRYVHQSTDDDVRRAGAMLEGSTFGGTGAGKGTSKSASTTK